MKSSGLNCAAYLLNYEIYELNQYQDKLIDDVIHRIFINHSWYKINKEEF